MKRGILVLAFLAVGMWAAAQTSSGSSSGGSGGHAASGTSAPAAGSVGAGPTGTGAPLPGTMGTAPLPGATSFPAGTPTPPGAQNVPQGNQPGPTNVNGNGSGGVTANQPLVTTPEVNLTTVMPSSGATNSTSNLPAGATNTTAMPAPMPMATTVPQLENGANMTLPMASENANFASLPPSGFNSGAATLSTVYAAPSSQNQSLGDIARQFRQKKGMENARLYTNADIDRLNQHGGQEGGFTSAANRLPNSSGGVAAQASAAGASASSPSRPASPFAPRVANPTQNQQQNQQTFPSVAQPQQNPPQPH